MKIVQFLLDYIDYIIGITIMNRPDFEKLHLINQLDEDDKTTVFKIVDTMLTKKKFKDFFAKNVAML